MQAPQTRAERPVIMVVMDDVDSRGKESNIQSDYNQGMCELDVFLGIVLGLKSYLLKRLK